MVNPIIQAEINYSLTLEIPLPLSLSGILRPPQTCTLCFFQLLPPEGRWKLETGNSTIPCFLMPGRAGRTLKPGNSLRFTSTGPNLEAGSPKLEIAPNPRMAGR